MKRGYAVVYSETSELTPDEWRVLAGVLREKHRRESEHLLYNSARLTGDNTMTDRYDEIRAMPTVVDNNHESVYRAYAILQEAKRLLEKGTPGDVVLEIIQHLEGDKSKRITHTDATAPSHYRVVIRGGQLPPHLTIPPGHVAISVPTVTDRRIDTEWSYGVPPPTVSG